MHIYIIILPHLCRVFSTSVLLCTCSVCTSTIEACIWDWTHWSLTLVMQNQGIEPIVPGLDSELEYLQLWCSWCTANMAWWRSSYLKPDLTAGRIKCTHTDSLYLATSHVIVALLMSSSYPQSGINIEIPIILLQQYKTWHIIILVLQPVPTCNECM